VALLRRIWARALQALAEGRPTKRWRHPATGLMPKTAPSKPRRRSNAGSSRRPSQPFRQDSKRIPIIDKHAWRG
jgi:hypothetical protein